MINSLSQIEQKLSEISHLLAPFVELWQEEALSHHPHTYQNPLITQWAQEIASHPLNEVADLMSFNSATKFSSPLQAHYQSIKKIVSFSTPRLSTQNLKMLKVGDKKRHEIGQLLSLIDEKIPNKKTVIDFAGGVGFLSQAIHDHFQSSCLVIEKNENLIQAGKTRLAPQTAINFCAQDIFQLTKLAPASLSIGLHCCGNLTTHLLDLFSSSSLSRLISIPCCYFKDPSPYTLGIGEITYQAKMLASRGYKSIDESDLRKWYQVKRHRYAFELYCQMKSIKITALKSALPALYIGSFADYCHYYFEKLNLPQRPSAIELNTFQQEQLSLIDQLIAIGFLRESFARPLELVINLLRMKQRDFKNFELLEIFNPNISPRNLALILEQKKGA
jgi:hypothetical protein